MYCMYTAETDQFDNSFTVPEKLEYDDCDETAQDWETAPDIRHHSQNHGIIVVDVVLQHIHSYFNVQCGQICTRYVEIVSRNGTSLSTTCMPVMPCDFIDMI